MGIHPCTSNRRCRRIGNPNCVPHNTTRCVLFCMTPEAARRQIAALEVQYALPAATGDAR